MWSPERLDPLGPVYVAIANALARDVESGRLEPGERLPTHRALARQLGVNVVTVTRAYQEAARRGLVEGEASGCSHTHTGGSMPASFLLLLGAALLFWRRRQ